jgi:hypothetical protein
MQVLDGTTLREFGEKVALYFLDFLQTDFKKQSLPRRRLLPDKGSQIRLEQFPSLRRAVRALLTDEVKSWKLVDVAPGRYTRPLNAALIDYLEKRIDTITDGDFAAIASDLQSYAVSGYAASADDPEAWIEDTLQRAAIVADDRIVRPLLEAVRATLVRNANDPEDRAFDLEATLITKLTEGLVQTLPSALNDYAISQSVEPVAAALAAGLDPAGCRGILKDAAHEFWTAEALTQLRELVSYIETGENLQAYLYVGTVGYRNQTYPLFYLPVTITHSESGMALNLEPHLYVNRQALEYILQDLAGSTAVISPIRDRIVYLGPEQVAADTIDAMAATASAAFSLPRVIKLSSASAEQESTPRLVLRNQLLIAAFDRADEALVNDYEQILAAARGGGDALTSLFESMLKAIVCEDPTSLVASVEGQWQELPLTSRLIAESPIPLNEEQRKILLALAHPDCRFVVVEGPPGTGKSHTISAIAFEAIRTGKSVLILSDKTEALDVVEDKLEVTIAAVRPSDDFPNPLLRLGKTGNNYSRLVSLTSSQQIMREHAAARANKEQFTKETKAHRSSLSKDLDEAAQTVSPEALADLARIFTLEGSLEQRGPDLLDTLRMIVDDSLISAFPRFAKTMQKHATDTQALDRTVTALLHRSNGRLSIAAVLQEARRRSVAMQFTPQAPVSIMRRLDAFGEKQARAILSVLQEYEALRRPLIGYLFRGGEVRSLERRLLTHVSARDVIRLRNDGAALKALANAVLTLADAAREAALTPQDVPIVYTMIVDGVIDPSAQVLAAQLADFSLLTSRSAGSWQDALSDALVIRAQEGGSAAMLLAQFIEYAYRWGTVGLRFRALGNLDYIGKKTQLERLYARGMANGIDERFVSFVTEHQTESKALARVIRDKAKFPADRFELLRTAFPIIIAGIRDFSEYMPLLPELFDLVIIDEGSQVSVAQAFPALLRAKQVVVFGDHRQFSNVKAANASNERNRIYRNDLDAFARRRISENAATLARLVTFDIKRSVLEFFDNCANYRIMLRKHFRGYQELIGFSSRYFYNGELQAIKIRNVGIADTIRFDIVHASAAEAKLRNVNQAEAEFIVQALADLLDNEEPPTVCVVTPFREQQQYISKLVLDHQQGEGMRRRLDLKILTFDTCQGLEREIVIYSLVETHERRVLNYIFPVSIEGIEDTVEEKLKAQRLNVGLSRAQEMMWFVLSKPIADFSGSIGTALRYYENRLKEGDVAIAAHTDPKSKMEAKVLTWLQQSPFVQRHQDAIRIRPQFPVGKYLRQLDKRYQHPEWEVDFLLTVETAKGTVEIIVEYDGFEYHFRAGGRSEIDASNFASFLSEADVERQLTLQQYGYRFVRLNRFNVGRDPVASVSKMLEQVIANADIADPEALTRHREDSLGLADGSRKRCTRCNQIRDREDFADRALKSGYGQICMYCKNTARSYASPGGRRGGRARRWSYGRRW